MKQERSIVAKFMGVRLSAMAALLALMTFGAMTAQAYTHEVWYSGGLYYWKTYDVTRGSSSDLSTAIQGAISTGNRDVHITTGGTLYSTIALQPSLNLYCHNNTFVKGHTGNGFYQNGSGPIGIYDMTLTRSDTSGMGIRTSRASDVVCWNVHIIGGSIGIRVDSHPSRPYEDGRWCYDLVVQDCTFDNCGSHGLETYGVDGVSVSGIVARNCGECGVLFNKTTSGWVGSIYAYRCCNGGGYAGTRFANTCSYMQVENSTSIECGRGIFILTGSNNIWTKNCYLINCTDIGIWFQDVDDCTVDYGVNNCGTSVSGDDTWANTTSSTGSYGIKRIKNRGASNMYIDGYGYTSNGANACLYSNTSAMNAYWAFIPTGSYYYLVNQGTGMKLDGYGRTSNGSAVAQYSSSTLSYNAQWYPLATGSYYYLVNRTTSMKVDSYGQTTNGVSCRQYSNSTRAANAQWSFVN